ncbi:MAG: TauD/TfdA family dioxygenase [Solirubrobacteraceae bacterium]|nr:TauD/TfdA family dioxygenase [Solirubrobacteraceae bacterium]
MLVGMPRLPSPAQLRPRALRRRSARAQAKDAVAIIDAPEVDGLDDDQLAADVVAQLDLIGAVLVRQFALSGDHRRLEALGRRLGTPSTNDVPNPQSPVVHRVEPMQVPERDRRGNPVLSTTTHTFPCHSDEFFSVTPADVIFLQCVRPASCGGGRTLIAPAREVTRRLSARTLEQLRAQVWPSEAGPSALLAGDAGDPRLRYNAGVLSRVKLSPELRATRDELHRAVERATAEIALGAGDLLIVDNTRVLHGRTSMKPGSRRLFLRMRAYRAG